MSWRVSGNLKVITADIKKLRVGAVVYSIGDVKHMARTSDHNIDSRGIVCAIDVMVRGKFTSADGDKLVRELIGRKDLAYVIYKRKIWSASHGWTARAYTGTDPHNDHVHVSSLHTAAADKYVKHVTLGAATVKPAAPPTPAKPAPANIREVAPKFPGDPSNPASYFGRSTKTNPYVARLQAELHQRGWSILADGVFGPGTEKVVKAFQGEQHLTVDGRVGPLTWRAIWERPIK